MMRWRPKGRLRIALDGPAGAGKGTVAAMLGKALGLRVVDTGALYRLVAWIAMQEGCSPEEAAQRAAHELSWENDAPVWRGRRVEGELRTEVVAKKASEAAAIPEVRAALLALQRRLAERGAILDGRDIGTVVLPDAEAKFFLTASLRERARRRWAQLKAAGEDADLEAIVEDIRARDARDAARKTAPLRAADDAIVIDTTTMRPDEVCDRILQILARRGLIECAKEERNDG